MTISTEGKRIILQDWKPISGFWEKKKHPSDLGKKMF